MAGSAVDVTRDSNTALQDFYANNPESGHLARRAKGILVLPDIVKAGIRSALDTVVAATCLKTAE